jgi:hypothetical protein
MVSGVRLILCEGGIEHIIWKPYKTLPEEIELM